MFQERRNTTDAIHDKSFGFKSIHNQVGNCLIYFLLKILISAILLHIHDTKANMLILVEQWQ